MDPGEIAAEVARRNLNRRRKRGHPAKQPRSRLGEVLGDRDSILVSDGS
jgi:hypothetical protein